MDVVVEEADGVRVACLAGPRYADFTDAAFADTFGELEAWLEARDLTPDGWIAVFYDPPDAEPEEGRSEACLPFRGDAPSEGGVAVRDEPPRLVARHRTTLDRVDDPDPLYDRLYQWIASSRYRATGDWFVREVYDRNPWMEDPARVRVDFQVPVRGVR